MAKYYTVNFNPKSLKIDLTGKGIIVRSDGKWEFERALLEALGLKLTPATIDDVLGGQITEFGYSGKYENGKTDKITELLRKRDKPTTARPDILNPVEELIAVTGAAKVAAGSI